MAIRRDEIIDEERGGYKVKNLLSGKFNFSIEDIAIYETNIPFGGKCKEQWHRQSYELVYFLTQGVGKINGKEYRFDIGDLVMLSPDEKHEFRTIDQEVRVLAIRFPDLPQDKYTSE